MYKTVFANKKPLNTTLILKQKKDTKFKEIQQLKKQFQQTSRIGDLSTFGSYINPLAPDYLDNCFNALQELLSHAVLIYNDKPISQKGSIILENELNNLLFNTANSGLLYDGLNTIKYSPTARDEIIFDIKQHKQAMFGELKHNYEKYHKIKQMWKQRQK